MRLSAALEEIALSEPEPSIEYLRKDLPEEWIEEALEATGTATLRRRRLPAEQVVWLVLGMSLYRSMPLTEIVARLDLALPSQHGSVGSSAIPAARSRVGSEPIEYLFRRTAKKWAHESAARDRWHGFALYSVDGTTIRVPDSPLNRSTFGNSKNARDSGEAAYPMVQVAALMALRSHLVAAVEFDGYGSAAEVALADRLWDEVPDQSVVLMDRAYFKADIFCGLTRRGNRHWVTRARATSVWTEVERLGTNDALIEVTVGDKARRRDRTLPLTYRARAISYQKPGYKPQILLTSLLDPEMYPASELVELYHERWEIELGYDEMKTHLLMAEETIRSKTPGGVRQELWGTFLLYNLIRQEMERAADEAKVPPTRISFVHSMRAIQLAWIIGAAISSPGSAPKHLRRLRSELKRYILPPRRKRSYPRAVKIKMSHFLRKRPVLK